MVSTRQSSNVGGGGENTGTVSEAGPSKSLRHNNAQPPPLPEANASSHIAEVASAQNINLMDLPPEILLKILGCLPYRSVAHLRPVRFLFSIKCIYPLLFLEYTAQPPGSVILCVLYLSKYKLVC
jgi:hypothetical protein